MKISVRLATEDIQFLDDYAQEHGLASRSAALHRAVRLLRAAEFGTSYAAAWEEWSGGEDGELWASTSGDGISPR